MPDYSKCCIYKLCCKDATIESIYIGSTTNANKRKCDHKARCTNPNSKEYNTYKYQFIREHGCFDNWDLIVIEEFSCNSKMEKERMERSYVEKLKPSLNTCIPANYQAGDVYSQTEYNKLYYIDNKEKITKRNKHYYEKNKEHILKAQKEQKKEYYKNNRDKINDQHKKNYEINKEQRRQYYEASKDRLCKPYECECGRTIQYAVKARHFRSKVHKDYMLSNSSSSSSSSSKEEV